MKTVPDILEQLGGVSAVSVKTGIPLTTVHSWKRSGSVPRWRIPTLVALAECLGEPITEANFPSRNHSANVAVQEELSTRQTSEPSTAEAEVKS